MRACHEQRQDSPDTRHGHVDHVEAGPLGGAEGGVNDHEDEEDRHGHDDEQPLCRPASCSRTRPSS